MVLDFERAKSALNKKRQSSKPGAWRSADLCPGFRFDGKKGSRTSQIRV